MIYNTKCIIFHIPRTGGSILERLTKRGEDPFIQEFGILKEYDNHITPDDVKLEILIQLVPVWATFVRHPICWYESMYRWHELNHGKKLYEKEPEFIKGWKGGSFEQFLDWYIDNRPGYYTELCKSYLGQEFRMMSFVGRYEHYRNDAYNLLRFIKWDRSDEVWDVLKNGRKPEEIVMDPVYRKKIEDLEAPIIERYYS